MKPSKTRAKTISQVIKELQEMLEQNGDIEVFTVNTKDECFDSVGRMVVFKGANGGISTEPGYEALVITPGTEVLKV